MYTRVCLCLYVLYLYSYIYISYIYICVYLYAFYVYIYLYPHIHPPFLSWGGTQLQIVHAFRGAGSKSSSWIFWWSSRCLWCLDCLNEDGEKDKKNGPFLGESFFFVYPSLCQHCVFWVFCSLVGFQQCLSSLVCFLVPIWPQKNRWVETTKQQLWLVSLWSRDSGSFNQGILVYIGPWWICSNQNSS